MRHPLVLRPLIALAATLLAAACSAFAQSPAAPSTPPALPAVAVPGVQLRAVVSIPPLKALVNPLVLAAAGGAGTGAPASATEASPPVEILIPPGVSEHGYEIPPAKLALLAKADVIVHVGLGLEPQLEDFLKDHPSPTRRAVEFAKAVAIQPGEHKHDHDHGHDGHDHKHDHALDPHLWLDPALVTKLIPAIRAAVEEAAAGKSGGTVDGLTRQRLDLAEQALLARVRDLDTEHRSRLAPHKGGVIIVAHDAWGRLADRYEFKTVAIKGMLATEPTPASIKAAVDAIREKGAKVVFTEPQLSRTTSQRVADAAGARLMELDPLGAGDWFATMRANLDSIVAAFDAQSPPTSTPPTSKPPTSKPPTPKPPTK